MPEPACTLRLQGRGGPSLLSITKSLEPLYTKQPSLASLTSETVFWRRQPPGTSHSVSKSNPNLFSFARNHPTPPHPLSTPAASESQGCRLPDAAPTYQAPSGPDRACPPPLPGTFSFSFPTPPPPSLGLRAESCGIRGRRLGEGPEKELILLLHQRPQGVLRPCQCGGS